MHLERVLEAAVQVLDQVVAFGVVGSGGDVLDANGLAQGVPDGTSKLRVSVGGDGCGYAKEGNPGGDESASAVVRGYRGQPHSFYPPGG